MKVSVLCTAYNHEKYIAQALDSFVSQKTDFPFEVLVTDDASTDGTTEIIREYAKKYPDAIRFFHQEKNTFSQGINLFTTVLFKEAKGEYFAWCEGDDYWTDDKKLQKQVDFLDAHPDYSGCVHNSMYHFCEGDKPDSLVIPESGDHDIGFDTIIKGMSVSFHTSSILIRAELIKNPPDFYNTAWNYGFTDYAIGIQMALRGKVHFIDSPMSVYRMTSNADAWSSGYHHNYGKLVRFITGEQAMINTLMPHLNEENAALAQQKLLELQYEYFYITGDVASMVNPPYDVLFKKEPFSFRLKTRIKLAFPALHEKYRKAQGYEEK